MLRWLEKHPSRGIHADLQGDIGYSRATLFSSKRVKAQILRFSKSICTGKIFAQINRQQQKNVIKWKKINMRRI
jgi:hypothetical protein